MFVTSPELARHVAYKHTKENHQGFVALIGQIQFADLESIIDPERQQLKCT